MSYTLHTSKVYATDNRFVGLPFVCLWHFFTLLPSTNIYINLYSPKNTSVTNRDRQAYEQTKYRTEID